MIKSTEDDTYDNGPTEQTNSIKDQRLILVHGLYRSARTVRPLKKMLTSAGFVVYSLNYYSVLETISRHSNKLHEWLLKHHDPDQPLYFVGHSLGGLVIRDFLATYPQWKIGNIVTLGTPHQGSISADYTKKIVPFMIGKSYKNGLDGHVAPLAKHINLGIIAGTKPRGIGTPVIWHYNKTKHMTHQEHSNDGTVYLYETKLPNSKDYLTLPVTHTGMIRDETVARQTIHFLQHAKFMR